MVTKFHPASLVRDLHALGVRDIGENRQQELAANRAELEGSRRAALAFHRSGAVEQGGCGPSRAEPCTRWIATSWRARPCRPDDDGDVLDVLVQVNLTDDAGRGGAGPPKPVDWPSTSSRCRSLRLRGVMGVAPLASTRRPHSNGCAGSPRASDRCSRTPLDIRRHDRRLRRGDQPRRDTPADRLGNHGPRPHRFNL